MRPIEYRTDIDFRQALRCVEYRIAPLRPLRPRGFALALGLRYGLVGAAAVHHLLEFALPGEEKLVFDAAAGWSQTVADHVRRSVAPRFPIEYAPESVGESAQAAIQVAIPMLRPAGPLALALGIAVEDFVQVHRREIRQGWGLFQGKRGERLFREHAEASQVFALNFHERRGFDLDEVREIALLGE